MSGLSTAGFAEEEPAEPTGPRPTRQPWEGPTAGSGEDQPGAGGTTPWQLGMYETLLPVLKSAATAQGMLGGLMETWWSRNSGALWRYLDANYLNNPNTPGYESGMLAPPSGTESYQRRQFFTNTPEGLNILAQVSLQWIESKVPGLKLVGGGGGGGGAKPPNIRAMFDLDQLAADVTKLTQAYLLQEHSDPRGVARAYVDAVVANPEQKLDFETFVISRLKANPRWTTLYKHKPAAISELQFMSQYTNIGQQMLGANRGWDWSGEQFHAVAAGADPQAWGERLERSNSYTSQAPYVAKLQERIAGLSDILKG